MELLCGHHLVEWIHRRDLAEFVQLPYQAETISIPVWVKRLLSYLIMCTLTWSLCLFLFACFFKYLFKFQLTRNVLPVLGEVYVLFTRKTCRNDLRFSFPDISKTQAKDKSFSPSAEEDHMFNLITNSCTTGNKKTEGDIKIYEPKLSASVIRHPEVERRVQLF